MSAQALLVDLYELTMAQSYFELDMHEPAVFELFVRRLPSARGFLIAAGLEQGIEYLEQLRFDAEAIDYLRSLGLFSARFLACLSEFRFTGSVHAMPEGTPFFAEEPILRVTAPILEAQLVESRLLNILHFQSVIASKAVRCRLAAGTRQLADFGMRRAHEAAAALYAARAAYIGGFDATATVAAGRRFGIPLSGTMAHSFIEAHAREEQAFRNFVATYPRNGTLLIDTYDVEVGARRAAAVAREAREIDVARQVRAVRIDSGDLARECRSVRAILDASGCQDVQIVLSGGLDEHAIAALVAQQVPVDAFGVGTALDVATDAPALDMVYKLQEYAGKPRRKRSVDKATLPGTKQVLRERGTGQEILGDHLVLAGEALPGEPLLAPVMQRGRRLTPVPPLTQVRDYCMQEVRRLPAEVRNLDENAGNFPLLVSATMQALAAELDAQPD